MYLFIYFVPFVYHYSKTHGLGVYVSAVNHLKIKYNKILYAILNNALILSSIHSVV